MHLSVADIRAVPVTAKAVEDEVASAGVADGTEGVNEVEADGEVVVTSTTTKVRLVATNPHPGLPHQRQRRRLHQRRLLQLASLEHLLLSSTNIDTVSAEGKVRSPYSTASVVLLSPRPVFDDQRLLV